MFEENYKNAMDNITPDADTRDKILDKIILKEELKNRKHPAVPWRVAFACVAALAIILGIVFVPRDSFKTASSNAPKTLTVSKSYNEIYKLIKPENDTSFWEYLTGNDVVRKKKKSINKVLGLEQDDAVEWVIEEQIEYADGAAPGATSSNNMNAQNGATKDETETNTTQTDDGADYSTTTEQVEGVREADIVKTDGKYIYYLIDNELRIIKAEGENSSLVSKTVCF